MGELYSDVDAMERTELTREGRVQKMWRVTATTKSGVRFSVDVKQADFTKKEIAKILAKRAAEIEEIVAL